MSSKPEAVVEVTAKDVQGDGVVFCPNPKMTLWSSHPRVYIDVVTDLTHKKCVYGYGIAASHEFR